MHQQLNSLKGLINRLPYTRIRQNIKRQNIKQNTYRDEKTPNDTKRLAQLLMLQCNSETKTEEPQNTTQEVC